MVTKRKADHRNNGHQVRELSEEEAREIFDRITQREMGMSGEEFLKRWHAGKYRDNGELGLTHVVMLLPLVE